MALGCAVTATAEHLTAEQALHRALGSCAHMHVKSLKARQLKQVNIENENVYVFSTTDNHGFLITPADDRMRPVLGYADEGTIDPDNMSPELAWWLSEYDREISAYIDAYTTAENAEEFVLSQPQTKSTIADNYAKWTPIAPLITTKWNQYSPYNDLCPLYNNSPSYGRCLTGCVATAMAQVVNYHKYYKGSGSKTYTPANWTDQSQTVSFDYENTTIDFSALKDTYTGTESNTTSGKAVATLMKACGVGVNMQYGPNESGANTGNIVSSLVENFGYDPKGCQSLTRRSFTTAEFESTIYNELANKRPVCYSGLSRDGGHCFIVDGYNDNGFFHLNWGWGGYCDGYFTLTALNPGTQSPFNYDQEIVLVAKPGSTNLREDPPVMAELLYRGQNYCYLYLYFSNSHDAKTCTVGLDIQSLTDDSVKSIVLDTKPFSKGGFTSLHIDENIFADLHPGQYKVYATYKLDDDKEYKIMPPKQGCANHMLLEISANGDISITNDEQKPEIRLSAKQNQKIYSHDGGKIYFSAINTSDFDFYDYIKVKISGVDSDFSQVYEKNGSTTSFYGSESIGADETMPFEFNIYPDYSMFAIPVGKYTLGLVTSYYRLISDDAVEFEVAAGSKSSTNETLTGVWAISDESVIPEIWTKGDTFNHFGQIYSIGYINQKWMFRINFYDKGTNTIRKSWTGKSTWDFRTGNTYALSALNDKGDTFTLDLPFGTYDMQYYIYPVGEASNYQNYKSSQRCTIRIGERVNNYTVIPAANNTGACVTKAPAGYVEIPASFNISGKSYATTEINEGLYRYNKDLKGIKLPSSVIYIGQRTFECCSNLKYVVFNNRQPVFDYVQMIAQNSISDCAWYVPQGCYDAYKSALNTHRLYETPSAMKGYTAYIDRGETAKLSEPFAQQGHYNFTAESSNNSVARVNDKLYITGNSVGSTTVTVKTPEPFANSVQLTVNVINPTEKTVQSLYDLRTCLDSDEFLPWADPNVMRSRCHYTVNNEMHVFDRQPGYAMVSDMKYTNQRMHGFKLTGLPASCDHSKTLKVSGRLVTNSGHHALSVSKASNTQTNAEAMPQSVSNENFDAAAWLHTYVKIWFANYDAINQRLNGFTSTQPGNNIVLPIKNLNNVALPAVSNRYDPEGYIDVDSAGNYFFVPTQDFGNPSNGVDDITVDEPGLGDARYFNLQGIEVKGTPAPGLYIRKAAGSTSKVVVR